ncbi:MAG: HD domain-containing protein [Minisyncoccia bacterium]
MNHTPEIKKAIQFAARKHHGQMRKGDEALPYITHLFSAALLVAEDDVEDAVVIATLLHDTLEDTDTTKEELARAFGSRVAEIVATVSEPPRHGDSLHEWKEQKKQYLAQLKLGSDDALLVAVADKIDNIEGRIAARAKGGPESTARWAQPSEHYLWLYGAVLRMAEERLAHRVLTKRLAEAYTLEQEALV